MIILLAALALVLVIFATLLFRALLFRPAPIPDISAENISTDAARAAETLAEMIKCKTVSSRDPSLEDEAEFQRFYDTLPKLFPSVSSHCELTELGKRSLLFKWKGKNDGSPTVLMAHYDVVSADADMWEKPPFCAEIDGGAVWGRGAIDTKSTVNGILFAAEQLISEGFTPENDIYFAFGGNEEVNGDGAPKIVEHFEALGITPSMVLDEGGAVVSDVFPGVSEECALIGIAEKGMLNLEYSVSGGGGHSSAPAPITPVGRLSSACVKLERSPFPMKVTPPARKLFDKLGRRSSFFYRFIFANMGFFAPVIDLWTKKSGGQVNAILRTTVAFTQMEGSKGENVIPPYARMVSNLRLIPGETVESALDRIKKTVSDPSVKLRVINGMDPSRVSETDCDEYRKLETVIRESFGAIEVSPYLMIACSDSRHWGKLSDKVYRFSPIRLTKEENATVHGNNEKLPVASVAKIVEFYIRLMKKC